MKKIAAALWLNTVLTVIFSLCCAGSANAATKAEWVSAFKFGTLLDLGLIAALFFVYLTAMSIVVLTTRKPQPQRKGEPQLA